MKANMPETKINRTIGVFYDGGFYAYVNDYYVYTHDRRAFISAPGLHEFICHEIGKHERVDAKYCQIMEAHHFRGQFFADDAGEHGGLHRDGKVEDSLSKAGVEFHSLPMSQTFSADGRVGSWREKGVDVDLAVNACVRTIRKQFDTVVLITGDADFVPLVRELKLLGARVMVLAWNLTHKGRRHSTTRTADALIEAATYPLMMHENIEERSRRADPLVEKLFVPTKHALSRSQVSLPQIAPNNNGSSSAAIPETVFRRQRVIITVRRKRTLSAA